MDALRKAEKEKKEAESRRHTDTGELQSEAVEAMDKESDGAPSAAVITGENARQGLPGTDRQQDEQGDITTSLSLAPIEALPRPAADDIPGGEAQQDITGPMHETRHEQFTLEEQSEGNELFDKTLHHEEIALESIPDLYEGIVPGAALGNDDIGLSFDETLPGVPAADLARDIGEEHQPTPVAAQTVFTAGSTTRKSAGFPWPLLTAAFVIIVAAISVIVYNSVTPIARDLPSPMVSRGIENIAATGQVADVAPETATGTLIGRGLPGPVNGVSDAEIIQQAAARQAAEDPDAASTTTAAEAMPLQESGPAAAPELVATPGTVSGPHPAAPAAGADGVLPAHIEVAPALIKISRSKIPDERGQMINAAFAAWQRGDLVSAGAAYQEILKNYPDNRDALLGLGAIALEANNDAQAQQYYARLLMVNPRDELARAVLISLEHGANPVQRESAIKSILQEHPEASYLHFTLGNIYASQSRWPEAQQAFFDAYRYNPANPDYANNLAVSLDHIGQVQAALDYYNTALELARNKTAKFRHADVSKRIRTLTGQ
jgi:tetratricopeptide (TPR) repeat protein